MYVLFFFVSPREMCSSSLYVASILIIFCVPAAQATLVDYSL